MTSKVHRVRYYNPKPQSINCAALNKRTKLLAIARENASIELWDLKHAPFCVKFIPGIENGSVEALGWVDDRLLSTGLGGALVEWDLDRLCPKTTVLLTGYAAWCLDVNLDNTLVAVGTEQGYINLYNVENGEIVYQKLFDKQEGRIMCCKFDKTGNILATGSVDTIRIWDVATGHATSRISARRRGKETIVWCLAILSDNVVVSGDSQGRLTFWDTVMGDQIETFVSHKSDILSLVVSHDEKKIYCAGVDPIVMNFIKMNDSRWMKHVQRNIHEHDVRALLLCGETLVSLGADGYITLSSFPPKWVMRIPPIMPTPCSSVSMKKKLLMLRYSNHLEVWKLGIYAKNGKGNVIFANKNKKQLQSLNATDKNKNLEQDTNLAAIENQLTEEKQILEIREGPIKLVSLETKNKKQIQSCELSPNGEFIVYATESHIRMVKLELDEQCNTSISKVSISGLEASCDRLAFTQDSQKLVVHSAGTLHVLSVDHQSANVLYKISTEKYLKTKSVLHLYTSQLTQSNAEYLVVADSEGSIAVWKHSSKKFEHYVTLPRYRCVPSALTIDAKNDYLIVVYVDQKLVEYDLPSRWVTDRWSAAPAQFAGRRSAALSVCVHPHRDALLVQDDTSLWILDRDGNINGTPKVKRRQQKQQNGDLEISLRIVPIKYLAGFHWLDSDEAVLLEVPTENIVAQLPAVVTNSKW